ncbi:pentapeptide repeat-containing protein [Spongiactinospora sp. TRM90649]|uniref:pentapeptide repeat-containing protein n=1 Tax=Spongiactinospora sp. TRM90649 TaxID=3031114 RepID=UPI0023F978A0|nr:pentapeptide repeat-containing protein [Spongiactinospora sp. TRM90649]MDF5757577.1 pentapeptide repeat-containing protein [Spongiactinospora sp. TRM90649]
MGAARRPYGRCLAHLEPDELDAALKATLSDVSGFTRGLAPAIDLRGVRVPGRLLEHMLSVTGGRLGRARFDHAVFDGDARFGGAVFEGDVSFDHACFHGLASFYNAGFTRNVCFRDVHFASHLSLSEARVGGYAVFDGASVSGDAVLDSAVFGKDASFHGTAFTGLASFDGVRFNANASFRAARFVRVVSFRRAAFAGHASFAAARFSASAYLAPSAVGGALSLAGADAGAGLALTAAGCTVDMRRLRVAGGPLTVRLCKAQADLEGAMIREAASLTGKESVRLVSLREVAASTGLRLSGLDLSGCSFTGLRHPELLRLSDCVFADTPRGVRVALRWPPLRWWGRRRVLADERALWDRPVPSGGAPPPTAKQLATLYSRLRAGVEDRHTATDFAFGEMEMRRHARSGPGRWLLWAYWLISGYGLRYGRAACWFALAALIVLGGLMWSGAQPVAHGVLPGPGD